MQNPDRLTQDEYENQFYDFSTTDLIERFKKVVKYIIQKALFDIENEIGKSKMYSDESAKNLQERIDKLYEVYMNSAKTAITTFEKDSRKMFAIPENVLLEEDRLKSDQFEDEDVENLKKDIIELERTLIREKVFLEKCKKMKETFESEIDPIYKKINNTLAIAKRNAKSPTAKEHNKLLKLYNSSIEQFVSSTYSSHMQTVVTLSTVNRDFFK